MYTNFESTSFWQIYLNGLKLNNAAVTSRLSIAALLSLSTPSCPLSRIVQRSRRRSGCCCKYLAPWIHTVKWCETRREREFVPGGSLLVSSRGCSVPPAVSGASRSAKEVLFLEQNHIHMQKRTHHCGFATLTREFTRTCLFDSRPSVQICWQLPRAHMSTTGKVRR